MYGGNLSARFGYCDAVSAAVGTGTTVDVVVLVEVLELSELGNVELVVDESVEAFVSAELINKKLVTTTVATANRDECFTFVFLTVFSNLVSVEICLQPTDSQ